ncbi:hypothetical protein ACFQ22_11530 [Lentilactobacillus raoultii]|uniref:Uncharacterized protein n=1 Tax=Lentilactobacillus raoultii TaxID=1987503 RepID=A0ABW3PJN2_9LACO|nr:hypothetical protein [Lentilactobacillus raoultii]
MEKSQLSDQINDAFIEFNREASRHADNTYVAQLNSQNQLTVIAIPYGNPDKPYQLPADFPKLLAAVSDKVYAAETGTFSQLKKLANEVQQEGLKG